MSGLYPTREQIDEMMDLLRRIKNGERGHDTGIGSPHSLLVHFGFLKREEVAKPCRECGRPTHDYSYDKITPAGRAMLTFSEPNP